MEYDSVTLVQFAVKGVVADNVARKAGVSAETVGERLLAVLSRTRSLGTVRHFKDVGHMTCGGGVNNCMIHAAAFKYLKNFGNKPAGIESRRLSGFNINLNIVLYSFLIPYLVI